MTGLSACVITRNEEDRVRDCLDSLAWCDEVIVVDSHSTDATRAIAESLGARVIERDWPGYAEQREFVIRAAMHDWVLCLDADERVSPELRAEIEALRRDGFVAASGWEIPRLTCYLGAWIRHGTWYPDRVLRLFDRRRGRWRSHPDYPLHEKVEVDGRVGRLRRDLWHYPYRSFNDHLRTIEQYTTVMAEGLRHAGRRATLADLTLRPGWEFVRFYVLKAGCLDGWRGLLLAYLHAHYVRLKYAKMLVIERTEGQPKA